MVEMSPQDLKNLAESISKQKVEDPDDKENGNDLYNRPPDMTGDPRDRRPKFDLYKVDFNWVAKETSKKELKGAYYALLEDKGYPDLLKAVRDRLKTLDPKFKTAEDFNNVTPAEEAAANEDVLAFLDQMNETDKKIRGDDSGGKSKAIFDDGPRQ